MVCSYATLLTNSLLVAKQATGAAVEPYAPGLNDLSSGYLYAGDRTIRPANISKPFGNDTDQPNKRNQLGTFLYLQRLEREPDRW